MRGQCTHLEARQAIQNAIDHVDSKCNWEFLLKSANLNIEPTYTTGTVAVAAGGTAVTGTGTTWVVSWRYKTIKLQNRLLPIKVSSFGSATAAVLANPLSGSTNITADTYVLYQNRYALPSDCDPGRDLLIRGPVGVGPDGWGFIPKIGRMAYEDMFPAYGGNVLYYTDDEYDETNNVGTIQFGPNYPVASGEYQIVYYKKLTVPTTDAGVVAHIPQAFERVLINRAAAELMRTKNMQGWVALQTEADTMLQQLYARHAASPAYEQQLQGLRDMPEIFSQDSLMHVRDF